MTFFVTHPTGVLVDASYCPVHNKSVKVGKRKQKVCACVMIGRIQYPLTDAIAEAAYAAMKKAYDDSGE